MAVNALQSDHLVTPFRQRTLAARTAPLSARAPALLRHLALLTCSFEHPQLGRVGYPRVYARPAHPTRPRRLEFIIAAESGPEGIGCVDDAARAALLALQVYAQQRTPAALPLAELWLNFVLYMQESDGRFTNFIVDESGRKNMRGRTSHAGGLWWSARAMLALATAFRLTGDRRYAIAFQRGRLAATSDLKITALQALALMEYYTVEPEDALRKRILRLCDRIVAARHDYFPDSRLAAAVNPWGYHQLQAIARAGRLFSRIDYLSACERSVEHAIAPLLARDFGEAAPWTHAPRCAYDVSTLVLGLEELYAATHRRRYQALASRCAAWLYGNNAAGTVLYNPRTGCCLDGLCDGVASRNCGAESSIEAGFVELARRRMAAGGR